MDDATHDWARELLAEYLVGGLSEDERADLEAHAAGRATCSDDLEELRKHDLSAPDAGESEPAPSEVQDRLIRSRRFEGVHPPRSKVGQALLSAAAIVLLGIVGYIISEMEQKPETFSAADSPVIAACAESPTPALERPREVFGRRGIPKDDRVAQPADEPVIFFPEAKS